MTTPARTAFDLGRRLGLELGVQRIDALMNATGLKVVDVEAVAEQSPGARGCGSCTRRLRSSTRVRNRRKSPLPDFY